MSNKTVVERLSGFVDKESPRPAKFLYRMWKDEQKAVTYKELREAILSGELSESYLKDWQQDYSRFIVESYTPSVQRAVKQVAKDLLTEHNGFVVDKMSDALDDFITNHGGQLIREISEKQYQAINTLVKQAALTDTMTVDQLARSIRPCIGLTKSQTAQTHRFYENLIEQGYSHKAALKRQATYAAKLHRERAASIAQNELAIAYNEASDALVRMGIEEGLAGEDSRKFWITAADERVCGECDIDGEEVGLNETFSNGFDKPICHVGCRCFVGYRLTPPKFL